jgi:AcrR family transcriptional regulator
MSSAQATPRAGAQPDGEEAERRLAGRRREVAIAALPVFLERGYAGTSMAALARATGLHKSSLYHHFPSKEALFLAALTAEATASLEAIEALVDRKERPADERLREAFELCHDAMLGSPIGQLVTVIAETSRAVPEVAQGFHDGFIARFRGALTTLYEQAVAEGTRRALAHARIADLVFGPLLSRAMEEIMFAGTPDTAEIMRAGRDRAQFVAMMEELTRTGDA